MLSCQVELLCGNTKAGLGLFMTERINEYAVQQVGGKQAC